MTAFSIALLSLFMLVARVEGASVEATRSLNLRECPSTRTCRVVMTVPAKKELESLGGRQGDWIQVKVLPEGTVGWVHSRYVAPVTAPIPQPIPQISLYPQAGTLTRLATHVLTLLLLLGIALFSPIRLSLERHAGQAPTRAPLMHLISDPKIVISWIILILAGIAGTKLVVNISHSDSDTLYIAQFFGYSGWALFWGVRPFGRLWVKVAKKLILWTPISLLGIILATFPVFVGSAFYAYWGGGILHFFRYWWKVRQLHAQNSVPAEPRAAPPSAPEVARPMI